MEHSSRCVDCMRELRPAVERAFAMALWRALLDDMRQRAERSTPVSASGVLLAVRAELEARTGLNLAEVGP